MSFERERVSPTKRQSFTPKQRAAVYAKQEGLCACGCGEPLPATFHIDHRIPIALAGAHELSNWDGLIPEHHRAKTKLDVKAIAKVKRIIRASDPDTRKKPRMRSRPFGRGLTKGFDGKVRRRT